MSARLGLTHVVVASSLAVLFAVAACSSSDGGSSTESPGSGTTPTPTPSSSSTSTPTPTGTTTGTAPPPDSGAPKDAGADAADAAPTVKQPGDPCTKGSECQPWDCTCKDGSTYKGFKVCESQQCATQQQACGLACFSSGGWAGP